MNEYLLTTKHKDVWRFTDALIKKLVEPETRKLQELVDCLVKANAEILQKPFLAFTQNGLIYAHSTVHRTQFAHERPTLDFSLSKQFDEYKKESDRLSNEKAIMRQVLVLLYQPTHNLQELRDATPECLVRFVEEFQNVPRCMNELDLVSDNERLVRHYKKTEELIKLHAAAHLFY